MADGYVAPESPERGVSFATMKRALLLTLGVVVLTVAAIALWQWSPHSAPDSGIRGTAQVPTACISAPTGVCDTGGPVRATVRVRELGGRIVGRAHTDPSGRLVIPLPPGAYVVRGDWQGEIAPAWHRVTVHRHSYARVDLIFDPGIS
jgi:hypothetical protein